MIALAIKYGGKIEAMRDQLDVYLSDPDFKTSLNDVTNLQKAANVEELCHAIVGINTINGVDFNRPQNYDVDTSLKLLFFNEAVCSSATIAHALYKREHDNDSRLWDALRNVTMYDDVMNAMESAYNHNPEYLTNGVAQFYGAQAWLASEPLINSYAKGAVRNYNAMLDIRVPNQPLTLQPTPTHEEVSWIGQLGVPQGSNILLATKPGEHIRFEDDDRIFSLLRDDVREQIDELKIRVEAITNLKAATPQNMTMAP